MTDCQPLSNMRQTGLQKAANGTVKDGISQRGLPPFAKPPHHNRQAASDVSADLQSAGQMAADCKSADTDVYLHRNHAALPSQTACGRRLFAHAKDRG